MPFARLTPISVKLSELCVRPSLRECHSSQSISTTLSPPQPHSVSHTSTSSLSLSQQNWLQRKMPALIVINVADPLPGLRLHLRSTLTPTPALAVTNRSAPLAAIETPSSPTAITLNIPTNTRVETLLSRILMAHRDGKTRRNCNPSSRLSFAQKSPSPPTPSSHVSSNTSTIISDDSEEEQDWCEDDDNKDDDSAFVEFEMVTGPMASCKIKLSSPSASPSPSDGSSSDSDSTTTQTEQGSSSSGFSTLSSSTLVDDDDDNDEGYFRIHEFTDVNKLIGASPAMHRSSLFVLPLEDRRRPSYYHHHIKQHPYPRITQDQYSPQSQHQHQVDEDETSSAAAAEPTFNFGFDADPYLDEDFGVLAGQQQQRKPFEAEAHARAHARSVKIVEPAKRTKKDVRKTMSFGKIKSKSTSPARFAKRVRRVPVPRYEDLDSPGDTPKTTVKSERTRRVPVPRYEDLDYPDINKNTRTSDTHTNARMASSVICTEESGKRKRKNSSEPWIATQQEVLDLVWGSKPIDLAQYWGSGKRRMTID